MTTISDSALTTAQPEWLIRQAADHYTASIDKQAKPGTRARHRKQFVNYLADVLPVWGVEKCLQWLRALLCGHYGQVDAECLAVVRALSAETATMPEGELRTAG